MRKFRTGRGTLPEVRDRTGTLPVVLDRSGNPTGGLGLVGRSSGRSETRRGTI